MAKKLGDFKLPTGGEGNIFSLSDILSLVIGSMVLLFTFTWGQKMFQTASRVMPGPLRDEIDPIFKAPAAPADALRVI